MLLANSIGLLTSKPEDFLQGHLIHKDVIEKLLQQREKARAAKDWKESDRIRDELKAIGIVIEDSIHGTTWRKA